MSKYFRGNVSNDLIFKELDKRVAINGEFLEIITTGIFYFLNFPTFRSIRFIRDQKSIEDISTYLSSILVREKRCQRTIEVLKYYSSEKDIPGEKARDLNYEYSDEYYDEKYKSHYRAKVEITNHYDISFVRELIRQNCEVDSRNNNEDTQDERDLKNVLKKERLEREYIIKAKLESSAEKYDTSDLSKALSMLKAEVLTDNVYAKEADSNVKT